MKILPLVLSLGLLLAALACAAPVPTPIPTPTPVPTATPDIPATVTARLAALPTATPYPTLTPWPTATPRPTHTPYPTPTAVPTATPYPTSTPYPTPTAVPTATPYPTSTPYPTPTALPTYTPYPTPTPNYPIGPNGERWQEVAFGDGSLALPAEWEILKYGSPTDDEYGLAIYGDPGGGTSLIVDFVYEDYIPDTLTGARNFWWTSLQRQDPGSLSIKSTDVKSNSVRMVIARRRSTYCAGTLYAELRQYRYGEVRVLLDVCDYAAWRYNAEFADYVLASLKP